MKEDPTPQEMLQTLSRLRMLFWVIAIATVAASAWDLHIVFKYPLWYLQIVQVLCVVCNRSVAKVLLDTIETYTKLIHQLRRVIGNQGEWPEGESGF